MIAFDAGIAGQAGELLGNPIVCETCLWASPEVYQHIATEGRRRLDIVWEGDEADDYDRVAAIAKGQSRDMQSVVKEIIRRSGRRGPRD